MLNDKSKIPNSMDLKDGLKLLLLGRSMKISFLSKKLKKKKRKEKTIPRKEEKWPNSMSMKKKIENAVNSPHLVLVNNVIIQGTTKLHNSRGHYLHVLQWDSLGYGCPRPAVIFGCINRTVGLLIFFSWYVLKVIRQTLCNGD